MRWFMITPLCSFGMQHVSSIPNVFIEGRILPVGTIIPDSFKGISDIENLYIPKGQLIEAYPTEYDLALLYMLWPHCKPKTYKAVFWPEITVARENDWYQIEAPDKRGLSSIPYAVSALADVNGICSVGDIAKVGDIVPASFFTGLSDAQFMQFERMGAVNLEWLNAYQPAQRAEYMRILAKPVMRRIAVDRYQKESLFQKFPAMSPEYKASSKAQKEDETIPVAPIKRKTTKKG